MDPANPYLLLTPGPLSTTSTVKAAMLRDWSTWDVDYNEVVQRVRGELTALAAGDGVAVADATAVLMQGSGTFVVEAAITSAVPEGGELLVVQNGAYGARIAKIAERARIQCKSVDFGELGAVDVARVVALLDRHPEITHVAMVHCETTTGMLNPAEEIGRACRERGMSFVLDAMSSFGGVPMTLGSTGADFLISSANKCIQGVPGFGFVVARSAAMAACEGVARSLSLDLFDQWRGMEDGGGKWRFTSPTHVVLAFDQALRELREEGGVAARHARYVQNQRTLVTGMRALGIRPLLPDAWQSPVITGFHDPVDSGYAWRPFYDALKARGFAIYPGKVTDVPSFRVGTIGDVHPGDVERLLAAIADVFRETGWQVG